MIESTECKSTIRDKYNRCVECGVEIFAGDADFIFLDENGLEIKRETRYTVGHVD